MEHSDAEATPVAQPAPEKEPSLDSHRREFPVDGLCLCLLLPGARAAPPGCGPTCARSAERCSTCLPRPPVLLVGAGAGRRVCRWLGISFASPLEQLVLEHRRGLGPALAARLCAGPRGRSDALGDRAALGRARARHAARPDRGRARALVANAWKPSRPGPWPSISEPPPSSLWPWPWPHRPTGTASFTTSPCPGSTSSRRASRPSPTCPTSSFPAWSKCSTRQQMLLRGDVAAKLLHYAFMLLLAGIVYLLAEQHLDRAHAWPAVTLYAAIPMVAVLGGWAYTDLALAFYQMAALYALLRWIQQPRLSWLALSGLLCGLAMGVKYTSFLCPLYLLLVVLIRSARRPDIPAGPRPCRRSGSLQASRCWSPPPGTSATWPGPETPSIPLPIAGSAPPPTWPGTAGAPRGTRARAAGWAGTSAAWLKLPWTLTLGMRDMNFYDGRVGPLFLLALPFLIAWGLRLFGRPGPRPPALRILIGFSLVQYLAWMAGVAQLALALSIAPALVRVRRALRPHRLRLSRAAHAGPASLLSAAPDRPERGPGAGRQSLPPVPMTRSTSARCPSWSARKAGTTI